MLLLLLAFLPAFAQKTSAADGGRSATPTANSREANDGEVDETAEYKQSALVKKFGAMLGMRPAAAATLFEVTNFAILAIAILWALGKALPKTFRDRTSGIQKNLVEARAATEEATVRLNSVEERLAKLDGQIAEMRRQAEHDTAADEIRIKASIEEDTKKILAAADQEIATATQQAQRQLQKYAAELAIQQATSRLTVSTEVDRQIVKGFVERLGKTDQKVGDN